MELKELFSQYDQADAHWEIKKAELEKATRERSEVVKQIALAIDPKKKLLRAGRELTVVVRGETYFFRGAKSSSDVVEVE
jgi:cell division protein FtsB